jgi:hypothetical protein
MRVTVRIILVENIRRFKWSATCPDGSEYKASSESFGASAKARDAVDQTFNNEIKWDWEYERHAPHCRGHVFVSNEV